MGACSILLRVIMGIINFLFFLLGAALVTTTCLLRWGKSVIKIDINTYIPPGVGQGVIDGVTIGLICIGGIIIILSLIGILGITCSNRCLLVLHEIVVILLFLIHLAALILLLVYWPIIERELTKQFNSTSIGLINNSTIPTNLLTNLQECSRIKEISNTFECCGITSPNDFSQTIQKACCKDPIPNKGCLSVVFEKIKLYSIYFLIIPTSVILFIELISIILVPILVFIISKNKSRNL